VVQVCTVSVSHFVSHVTATTATFFAISATLTLQLQYWQHLCDCFRCGRGVKYVIAACIALNFAVNIAAVTNRMCAGAFVIAVAFAVACSTSSAVLYTLRSCR